MSILVPFRASLIHLFDGKVESVQKSKKWQEGLKRAQAHTEKMLSEWRKKNAKEKARRGEG